jgi:hypothetical protein
MHGIEHQRLMIEFGKKRKEERAAKARKFEGRFVNIAREVLDKDVFIKLVEMSRDK